MKTNVPDYLKRTIIWLKTDDPEFPFEANINQHQLTIRINDFPTEPFYTLLIDHTAVADFDDWPKNWQQPEI